MFQSRAPVFESLVLFSSIWGQGINTLLSLRRKQGLKLTSNGNFNFDTWLEGDGCLENGSLACSHRLDLQ